MSKYIFLIKVKIRQYIYSPTWICQLLEIYSNDPPPLSLCHSNTTIPVFLSLTPQHTQKKNTGLYHASSLDFIPCNSQDIIPRTAAWFNNTSCMV